MIQSCLFGLEDYLFLFADLWELEYSSSGCQLSRQQGGGLRWGGGRVSCHAGIIIVAAGGTGRACATVHSVLFDRAADDSRRCPAAAQFVIKSFPLCSSGSLTERSVTVK